MFIDSKSVETTPIVSLSQVMEFPTSQMLLYSVRTTMSTDWREVGPKDLSKFPHFLPLPYLIQTLFSHVAYFDLETPWHKEYITIGEERNFLTCRKTELPEIIRHQLVC